jgi:hypothetical protein
VGFYQGLDWTAIASLTGIAALLVSILFFLLGRRRRALSWRITALTPLVTAPEGVMEGLSVSYDGKPVRDGSLMLVRVKNTGNQPIEKGAYDVPLELALEPDKEAFAPVLLTAKVVDPKPASLPATLILTDNKVRVEPLLLNPEDSFTIQIIAEHGDNAKPRLEGHIHGISKLQEISSSAHETHQGLVLLFAVFSSVVISTFLVLTLAEVYALDGGIWVMLVFAAVTFPSMKIADIYMKRNFV